MNRLWTVARFPNGAWDTGGSPNDPAYSECEIWQIEADSRDKAKKIAQGRRARQERKKRNSVFS